VTRENSEDLKEGDENGDEGEVGQHEEEEKEEAWEVSKKVRIEKPKKANENKRERKSLERFCGVQSLWLFLEVFFGELTREASGESESK
jgi:hypothetical protein